jgi:hypothetical protein
MISERERFAEWLRRAAIDIRYLQISQHLSREEKLRAIRANYGVISVLIKVAEGKAYMIGIPPITDVK